MNANISPITGYIAFIESKKNYYDIIREKFDETKYKEYKSYAKVHILDSSLISLIQSIEKESITNSNPDNSSERERSIIIHEAAGLASNTVTAVNTFYQVILDYDDYSEEAMNDAYELIESSSKKLSLIDPKIQKTLYKNVKDIRRSSNKYILSLVCINLFLLTVCIILRML